MGAQKNFAAFARRIGQAWRKSQDDFNEAWYRVAVAKAIIFKSTERIVSEQPWYQGGYRANIVTYTIAKLAHDVADLDRAVDFEAIWKQQSPGSTWPTRSPSPPQGSLRFLLNPQPASAT